jgi:hypothetical protein
MTAGVDGFESLGLQQILMGAAGSNQFNYGKQSNTRTEYVTYCRDTAAASSRLEGAGRG